jgi:hypothetical protein
MPHGRPPLPFTPSAHRDLDSFRALPFPLVFFFCSLDAVFLFF